MSYFVDAKTPNDTKLYSFVPDMAAGDNIRSFTMASPTLVFERQDEVDDAIVFAVSGGAAGTTAVITLTVTTEADDVLEYTIYLPIIASTTQIANTGLEYCSFALRRIIGNGEVPSADELADALERLNALVSLWRAQGADIGAVFPITASTVIYCPDYAATALRYNLLMDVASLYGEQVTQQEAVMARNGLALIQHRNLPDIRSVEYF